MRFKLGLVAGTILIFSLPLPGIGESRPRFRGVTIIQHAPLVTLVNEDVPAALVVTRADAPPQEKLAARELAAYLSRIAGTEFKTATLGAELPRRSIVIGPRGTKRPPELSPEGFLIRTGGLRIGAVKDFVQIIGGTPHATLMGVYAFLEEQMGCRWWAWDAEFVPRRKKPNLDVLPQSTHIEPAFRRHNVFNREAQNSQNQFARKLRTVSMTNFTGGHNICSLLKPHAKKNPVFFSHGQERSAQVQQPAHELRRERHRRHAG